MAPEEAWRHHGCGDLSGVNGTPLPAELNSHTRLLRLGKGWREGDGMARWNHAKGNHRTVDLLLVEIPHHSGGNDCCPSGRG